MREVPAALCLTRMMPKGSTGPARLYYSGSTWRHPKPNISKRGACCSSPHEDTGNTLQPEISGTLGTHELVLRENKWGEMHVFCSTSARLCQEKSPGHLITQESLQCLQPHKGFTQIILETKWQKKPKIRGGQRSQDMPESCNPTFSQVSLEMIYEG